MTFRTAVYGGSFSPFGLNHLKVIDYVARSGEFDHILLIPSISHALKTEGVSYEHRFNMAKLGDPTDPTLKFQFRDFPLYIGVEVLMTEFDMLLEQSGPIYTIDLLRKLQRQYPEHNEYRFVVGYDIKGELDKWKYVEDIRKEFSFFEVADMGFHASQTRKTIKEGDPSWTESVPTDVVDYIRMHNLYDVKRTDCDHSWEEVATVSALHIGFYCEKCSADKSELKENHP